MLSVMAFEGDKAAYATAHLGNALRGVAADTRDTFVRETNAVLSPLRDQLYTLISMRDARLLKQGAAPAP